MKMRFPTGLLFMAAFINHGWAAIGTEDDVNKDINDPFSDIDFHNKLFDPKHSKCLEKYLGNSSVVIEEFNQAAMEDKLPMFMKTHCPQWRKSIECYDALTEELQPHLNFIQKLTVSSIRRILLSSIDYLCENNGKRFLEFIDYDGLSCIDDNMDKLKLCVEHKDFGMDFFSKAAENEAPTLFSGNECQLIHNATDCILQTMKQSCSNHSHAFFHDLLSGILKQTPCWHSHGIGDVVQWEHFILATLLPKHIPRNDRACKNNATAFELAQQNLVNASKCWNGIIDNNFLVEDVTTTMESGTYPSFLKKYCPKLIELTGCIGSYLDSFQQCVDGEDSITLEATKDIIAGIANFLCHRDGERILLFMKDEGPDCLAEQQENIIQCVENAGVKDLFKGAEGGMQDPVQVINNLWVPQNYRPEECRVIVALEVCVFKTMRQCNNRTPANLISSLIRSIARKSPCWNVEGGAGGSPALQSFCTATMALTMFSTFIGML